MKRSQTIVRKLLSRTYKRVSVITVWLVERFAECISSAFIYMLIIDPLKSNTRESSNVGTFKEIVSV